MTRRTSCHTLRQLLIPLALLAGSTAHAQLRPAFTDVAATVGLDFVHDAAVEGDYFMAESIGSGGALFDYDGDGDLDVYLINGTYRDPARRAETPLTNQMFRQNPGFRFVNVTEDSGLGDAGYGIGVAVGDADNDGDLDVYVANYGADRFYRNEGGGRFVDATSEAGIDNEAWSSSALFFDFDLDGDLDVYVANYVAFRHSMECFDRAGRLDYCGPKGFDGVADVLYRNRGDGTFEDVSERAGLATGPSKGLGVASADFNRDGLPDVFVANDGVPNQLWVNQGGGRFVDEAFLVGLAVDGLGNSGAGMGVALGDADGDGALDLYVTQLFEEHNVYYRNLGPLGFADETANVGLLGPDRPYTGFGTALFDRDNDGDLDLAVVNGRVIRGRRLTGGTPSYWDDYAEPNLLFENDGQGRFENVSRAAGEFCTDLENSRGLAVGDVDEDGDLDLLVTNEGGRLRLYRNDLAQGSHYLLVRARDPRLRRDAVGAVVSLRVGERVLTRPIGSAYSFASGSDPRAHFGLGSAAHYDSIEIIWPGDEHEIFPGGSADRVVVVERGSGESQ